MIYVTIQVSVGVSIFEHQLSNMIAIYLLFIFFLNRSSSINGTSSLDLYSRV